MLRHVIRMKLKPSALSAAVAIAGASALASQAAHAQELPALLQEYCTECHNLEDYSGGLDIEGLDFAHVETNAAEWEKIVRKLKAGMMPPKDQERPDRATMDAFAREVERQLDAQVTPHPVAPALHRLNRNEYANAIRDIFHLDVDTAALLPQDDASEGFDNIASGLGISPALIQGYTSAAMKISRWVVGDMTTTESAQIYKAPASLSQDVHLEGMPLGTRGGLKVVHNFPLDAEYDFSVRGGGGFFNQGGARPSTRTIIMLDGAPLEVADLRSFRLPITAGEHELLVSVLYTKRPTGVNDIYSVYNVGGGIDSVQIMGPYNATGPGHTASRESVFSCYPQSSDEERRCAEQIAVDVATRAFRAPVAIGDLEPVMAFYEQGRQQGGDFEAGIQQALSRVLLDPRFLFRFEEEPEDVAPGASYRISDVELATRLSFFLWSSVPDNELLDLAVREELSDPKVMHDQVLRMLSDPKAQALVDNFAGQWLHLRELGTVTPEDTDFDDNLRQSFIEETELLFANVIAEDLPVTELLTADYSYLNERLARHYGIDGVRGSHFRKVQLPADNPRRGILGHGSILTITSTASRTSPVIRGSWILDNLLSAPVPDPPPGVETNLDGDGTVVLTSSIRERLENHRKDPSCGACHSVIDPVGFSLENFDSIGAWRTQDGDSAVDPRGTLVDGTAVASAEDLRKALMSRSELFVTTFTEKLMTYALGRAVEYHDMPSVRAIMRDAEATNHSFTELVLGVVQSPQFTQRIKSDPNSAVAANP
jgi:mono/diheme cytochrome c family protein